MDSGTVQGIVTIVFMGAFIALTWIAFKPSNKAMYEKIGRIPLENDKGENRINDKGESLKETTHTNDK